MQVGTYIDGRPLTYDEDAQAFHIGDARVTPDMISAYDLAHQLSWADEGVKAWASSMGITADAAIRRPVPLPVPEASTGASGALVWLLVGAAGLVLVAVIGVVVAFGVFADSAPKTGFVTRVTPAAVSDDGSAGHTSVDVVLEDGKQYKDVAYYATDYAVQISDEVTIVREGDGWRIEKISVG